MTQILQKAAKYKRVSTLLCETEAHLKDSLSVPPTLIKPPPQRSERLPDDITDFPHQRPIPLPEMIPYSEGKYRPASIPFISGYFPYNMYLQQGKVYQWCSCGISQAGPWCDGLCNSTVTRNRPIMFNVDTTGYYKICNCKHSANAPFCNGTHRAIMRQYHKSFRGFYEIQGWIAFMVTFGYILWNFYS